MNKLVRMRFFKSILGRLLTASLLLLPLFCGLLGISLDQAYTSSLRSGAQTQLTLQAYALISAAEFDEGRLWLPEQLTEDRLNQSSSNLFAAIFPEGGKQPAWRSPSAINNQILNSWQSQTSLYGQPTFGELSHHNGEYFYLQYNVFWEDETHTQHPFHFVIFEDQKRINQQIAVYRKSLWGWLSAIALSITLILALIMKWGLKPLREVSNELRKIQQGNLSRLEGFYPTELSELTDSINTLLSNEAQQRARYQNTLSDLAHSLKTPLAIMQGNLQADHPSNRQELEEQVNRMNQIVSHQLKRSVSSPRNPFSQTCLVKEVCESVISALTKVYRERLTTIELDIPETLTFRGDKGDLLEVLGNLLDNAFKYGNGIIQITGRPLASSHIMICIEDNGSGVNQEQYKRLLQRGERADTSIPGQGIGLSVVTDIISSYRGSIELSRSSLGGLAVTLHL